MNREDWIKELCPEIADWQVELIAEQMRKEVAAERESIAKMFDEPMRLVPFVQNHLGGCVICGFTPSTAAAAIRARSNT